MVLFHHIEQAKAALGIPNLYYLSVIQHMGRLGVGLFFVLSGFLITYLLLQEKQNHGNIATGKFYLRRIFRIWPIYFLIVALSYFVFPYVELLSYPGANDNVFTHYNERLFFLALVLPNYAFVLYDLPYWCAQAWSIGVEEQFYYLWPWLIKYPKRSLPIFLFFISTAAGVLFLGLQTLDAEPARQLEIVTTFLGQFRIQTMAVGGVCAYLVFSDKVSILKIVYRQDVQIAVYLTAIALFASGIHFWGFMEVYSLFFGYFILNLSSNPKSIVHIKGRFMTYSGKISYGLYLYHVIALVFVLNVFRKYLPALTGFPYHLILYVSVVGLSILLAALLYEFLEKPILRYKDQRYGR